jgi:hypothetical protein
MSRISRKELRGMQDGRPYYRAFIELVLRRDEGDLLSYSHLSDELEGLPLKGIYNAHHLAKGELAREHETVLRAVKNVGYVIVRQSEHLDVAVAHQRKAFNQFRRAKDVLDGTDLSGLSRDDRIRLDQERANLVMFINAASSRKRRFQYKPSRGDHPQGPGTP